MLIPQQDFCAAAMLQYSSAWLVSVSIIGEVGKALVAAGAHVNVRYGKIGKLCATFFTILTFSLILNRKEEICT
jgi:hypothetical protein